MTKNFDTLVESVLSEMAIKLPNKEEVQKIVDEIVANILAAKENSGHWAKIFKSKKVQSEKDEAKQAKLVHDLVWEVVKKVFPENEHTYNPDILMSDLKPELVNAIKEIFEINNTYSGFLSDRFGSSKLLGRAVEVIAKGLATDIENNVEGDSEGGIELVPVVNKENMTQKEMNAALKKKEAEMRTPEYQKSQFDAKASTKGSDTNEGFDEKTVYTLASEYDQRALNDEQKAAYDILEQEIGTVDKCTGKKFRQELDKLAKRGGILSSNIGNILKNFVSKDILVPETTSSIQQEPDENDLEKGGAVPIIDDEYDFVSDYNEDDDF